MDTFSSSPSRLNRKLFCYSYPLSPYTINSNPNYDYISKNIKASCQQLESRLRHLSYRVNPNLKRSTYQYAMATSPMRQSKQYRCISPINHAQPFIHSPIGGRVRDDKYNAASRKQYSNLSDLAKEKMSRLNGLNEPIDYQLNQYERKAKKTSIDGRLNHSLDYQRKFGSMCNRTEAYTKEKEKEYMLYGKYSYHRPVNSLIKQPSDYTMTVGPRKRTQCRDGDARTNTNTNTDANEINALKAKIYDLEREIEAIKQSQRQEEPQHYSAYSFN